MLVECEYRTDPRGYVEMLVRAYLCGAGTKRKELTTTVDRRVAPVVGRNRRALEAEHRTVDVLTTGNAVAGRVYDLDAVAADGVFIVKSPREQGSRRLGQVAADSDLYRAMKTPLRVCCACTVLVRSGVPICR